MSIIDDVAAQKFQHETKQDKVGIVQMVDIIAMLDAISDQPGKANDEAAQALARSAELYELWAYRQVCAFCPVQAEHGDLVSSFVQ